MKTKRRPKRIVVDRTDALEELLQQVWLVRPELKNRLSWTISTALAALTKAETSADAMSSSDLTVVGAVSATSTGSLQQAPDTEVGTKEPHPDTAWN